MSTEPSTALRICVAAVPLPLVVQIQFHYLGWLGFWHRHQYFAGLLCPTTTKEWWATLELVGESRV
jgi:hypothetical protein